MLKYILFLQLAFTFACTHFAFAIASGVNNHEAYYRAADAQEIRAMPVRVEGPVTCEAGSDGCNLTIHDTKSGKNYRVIAGSFSEDATAISQTGAKQNVAIEGQMINPTTISAQSWKETPATSN